MTHHLHPLAVKRHAGRLAAAAAVANLAVACSAPASGAEHVLPARAVPNLPSEDTSQTRIAAALAANRIDYPTSLRYRFDALFGSDDLPSDYRAAHASADDPTLFRETTDSPLRESDTDALIPFITRPSDPGSIFAPPPAPAARHLSWAPGSAAGTCVPGSWLYEDSTEHAGAYRVWAACTGDYATDMATVVGFMDQLYGPMTSLMGAPLPDVDPGAADAPGGNDGIDIYLLSDGEYVDRDGHRHRISPGAVATTFDANIHDTTSSGYILVGRGRLGGTDAAKADIAHEFFHVLQDAHDASLRGPSVGGHPTPDWFTEASAVWAEFQFVPEARAGEVYGRFTKVFSKSDLSLFASGALGTPASRHMYASFVWPLFMEQQRGALGIQTAWRSLEGVTDPAAELRVLNGVLGFSTYYHEFAAEALDIAGIAPSFQQVDRNFPTTMPHLMVDATLPAQDPEDGPYVLEERGLNPLAAHYERLRLSPGTRQLQIGLDGLHDPQDWDVDAVVHRGGAWQNVRLLAGAASICDAQRVDRVYLVLANHSVAATVKGRVTLRATTLDCHKAASPTRMPGGSFTETQKGTTTDAYGTTETDDVTAEVHLTLSDAGHFEGNWSLSGTWRYDDQSGGCRLAVLSGSGTFVPDFSSDSPLGAGRLTLFLPGDGKVGFRLELMVLYHPAPCDNPETGADQAFKHDYSDLLEVEGSPIRGRPTDCDMTWSGQHLGISFESHGEVDGCVKPLP